MYVAIIVVVAILLILFLGTSGRSRTTYSASPSEVSKEEKLLDKNKQWLEERWNRANQEKESGELKTIPQWFFDDVTEHQLRKLEEIGLDITVRSGKMTKGQASDLIGLLEPIEHENEEILRFFQVPLRGMNQSKARNEVSKLLSESDRLAAWTKRPASPMQKEFYRFFSLKVPKGLTHKEASVFISEYQTKMAENEERKLEDWDTFEDIYDEINDPDFRDDYDLKRISLSLFRDAIKQLRKEGKNMSELVEDTDIVVDKIVELKPEIRKS